MITIHDEFLKPNKIKIDFSSYSLAKHLHRNFFVNMGELNEENIFLEADETPTKQADESSQKVDTNKTKNENVDDKQIFSKPSDKPNTSNPFDDSDIDDENSVLLEGLPKDEQYYVIILKSIHQKLIKLNDVSLRLFSNNNEMDQKIAEKISTIKYVFTRFIEQYDEYENPRSIIIKLQKLVDAIIIYVNDYIKNNEK